jgi:hypothetical protein
MADEAGTAHDFDFWIGEWDVFNPDGKQVGRNTITSMFGNGMVHEHWRGNGGVEGRSVNAYDAARGVWHQTWMDSTGGVLLLDGGVRDGAMVLEGLAPSGEDMSVVDRQRITWTPGDQGPRQLWESSNDDGQTWTVAFDGRYRPHAG